MTTLRFIGWTCAGFIALGAAATARADEPKKITIGMVAKSQSNTVFQAAYAGAKDAAKELGPQYGVEVTIDWQTPPDEDAQKQAEAVEALSSGGAQGICVSCSEAHTLTPAINDAVARGSYVVCFDSDAPRSKRFACYGTDDAACGKTVMDELAKVMGEQGTIAILAGNQSAPNLQKRVAAVKEELQKYPNMNLLDSSGGVFYHQETPQKAVEAMTAAQNANPQIQGWALVGGWPLFTVNALPWPAGQIKVVSVDALPAELAYLRDGHVQVLLAQDCYGWGYKSVQILLDKIVKNQDPPSLRVIDPLQRITTANVDEFAKNWDKWLGK